MKFTMLIIIILAFAGPLWVLFNKQVDLQADWTTANRNSAHLAPDPQTNPEALIQMYSARAFNWRGLFATHVWIATKAKNASNYTVYQVIGWLAYRGLSPLDIRTDLPDRYWFGQKPNIIYELRGEKAEAIIPQIAKLAQEYPYNSKYIFWPGPNSNTFPAYIARRIPELGVKLPSTAIGKDFLPGFNIFARAPSCTGYQLSLLGLLGITLARSEGLEVNLLGLVYGINIFKGFIDLPGLGEISFKKFFTRIPRA